MKQKALLGRVLLALVSIILTLVLVDYLSIDLLPTRAPLEQRFPVEVFRKPRPYMMFGGTPGAEFEYEDAAGKLQTERLNSLGYRGPEPVMPKPAGEYRIFVLGGSTVFLGDPPIPASLEAALQQAGLPQVRVYNFGVISSVSSMELAQIVFEVSELAPDLIVMYNGGNDILGPYRHDPRPGYPFNFLVYENNPLVESNVRSYPALALLAYGSNLARYFFPDYFLARFSSFEEMRARADYGSERWREEIAGTYVNNLVKGDQVAQAFGADFIAFAQPLLYFKPSPAPEEADLAGNEARRDHCNDVRQRIRDRIERDGLNRTVKIVDLSAIYDDTAEWVFTDSIHIRQEAQPVIVQAMAGQIVASFGPVIGRPAGAE